MPEGICHLDGQDEAVNAPARIIQMLILAAPPQAQECQPPLDWQQ